MSSPQTTQEVLSLPLSPDDLKLIAEAAAQTHKTEAEFILGAALEKAKIYKPKPMISDEEYMTLIHELQEKVRRAVPDRHKAFEDFLAERRAEAMRE